MLTSRTPAPRSARFLGRRYWHSVSWHRPGHGTAGCASYRTSSNIESKPAPVAAPAAQVLLAEDGLPGRKYTELGPIEVSVKKLTVFHKDPTKEQANEALIEKARSIGAN